MSSNSTNSSSITTQAINSSSSSSTIITTNVNNTLRESATTTTIKPHITSQLFLQSTSCQAISGTFAWVALIITIHHVSRKKFEYFLFLINHLFQDLFTSSPL